MIFDNYGADLPPLDGENSDLREWVKETLSEDWLTSPNDRLYGQSPEQVIDAGHGARVREIVRQIIYIGIS